MVSLPTKSIEIHPEAIEPASERVMAFGRQLLAKSPVQVLDIVEQQARRLLSQQAEINDYRQQLAALEKEVADLQAEQVPGSVAPFRLDKEKRERLPKRPGRKLGHRGQ